MSEEEFKAKVMPGCRAAYAWACAAVGAEDASDIAQESLRRLWERRAQLHTLGNITSYALVIAKNMAADILQERQRWVRLGTGTDKMICDCGIPEAEGEEERALLDRLLEMLPDSQQTVVRMSLMGEMANSDIAEATGMSHEAVRQNLSRGRKRLRELYKEATK